MEMEGQGQPRGEESEFRELLVQMQDIIREVGELEERWQGLNPERRRAERQEIEERIVQVIERWQRFPHQAPEQMHVELDRRIIELGERGQRFPDQFRWLQLLRLPRITIQERHPNHEICTVCQDEFLFGEVARDLPCGHRFHHTCIFQLVRMQPNCPTCRTDINQARERRRAVREGRRAVRRLVPPAEEAMAVHPLMPREIMPIPISRNHISDHNSITSTCPICLEDFKLGEEAGGLHCGHIYHQICISISMRLTNSCPICRREFQFLNSNFSCPIDANI